MTRLMEASPKRLLSLAARNGRLACVFFRGKELVHWYSSVKGVEGPSEAAQIMRAWLAEFSPEIIVTENPDEAGQKGRELQSILRSLAATADDHPALNLQVIRRQDHKNLYEEAAALSGEYPQIAPWRPNKPRIWEGEPSVMALFEALSMANQIISEETG